ncbi:MAG: extracellular solute-binding protein [Actinomycetia bacterium]|nr:extracellular solute-binding protein [Actinomycetes bacterium]
MISKRWRVVTSAAVVAAATLMLTGCTGSSNKATTATSAINASSATAQPPTTITVWTFNKLPTEVKAIQDAIDALKVKDPWLTVNLVTAKTNDDFTKAVTAGNPPDVFISSSPDNAAKFCYNGAVIDMNPLAQSAGLDIAATFPPSVLSYTQFDGKQCALPLLVDSYALYYNKAMFQAAGISSPPKTLSELTADAKKLTVKNSDGSIKVFGLEPPTVTFAQNDNWFIGGSTGAQFYDANGKTTFASDPTWVEMLNWQKDLLDWYGSKNVTDFVSKYNAHEDDAQNPFETEAAAMAFAGEWHIGEIADNTPNLDYGTAPVPVPDSKASIYGAGSVLGTVVYISSKSNQQAAAFLAVQQLTTDTDFLTTFATQMSNIPTTFDSLQAWTGATDDHWKAYVDIAANPNSYYKTLTPAGVEDHDDFMTFIQQWEQGKVSNLQAGLADVGTKIDQLNAQSQ